MRSHLEAWALPLNEYGAPRYVAGAIGTSDTFVRGWIKPALGMKPKATPTQRIEEATLAMRRNQNPHAEEPFRNLAERLGYFVARLADIKSHSLRGTSLLLKEVGEVMERIGSAEADDVVTIEEKREIVTELRDVISAALVSIAKLEDEIEQEARRIA
jgi:NTP pyrophosphatase (non-canonical NTP hydrolase)